jgi:hypothetical protein
MGQVFLKFLAISVAVLFLLGAMVTATTDLFTTNALAAPLDGGTPVDAGAPERTFLPATKSGLLPRQRAPNDAGHRPVFFPASKSAGGEALPGTQQAP